MPVTLPDGGECVTCTQLGRPRHGRDVPAGVWPAAATLVPATVIPAAGTPASTFVVSFTSPDRTGVVGSKRLLEQLVATSTTPGKDCLHQVESLVRSRTGASESTSESTRSPSAAAGAPAATRGRSSSFRPLSAPPGRCARPTSGRSVPSPVSRWSCARRLPSRPDAAEVRRAGASVRLHARPATAGADDAVHAELACSGGRSNAECPARLRRLYRVHLRRRELLETVLDDGAWR